MGRVEVVVSGEGGGGSEWGGQGGVGLCANEE